MRRRLFSARPALLSAMQAQSDVHVAVRDDLTICNRPTALAKVVKVGETVTCPECLAWLNDEETDAPVLDSLSGLLEPR